MIHIRAHTRRRDWQKGGATVVCVCVVHVREKNAVKKGRQATIQKERGSKRAFGGGVTHVCLCVCVCSYIYIYIRVRRERPTLSVQRAVIITREDKRVCLLSLSLAPYGDPRALLRVMYVIRHYSMIIKRLYGIVTRSWRILASERARLHALNYPNDTLRYNARALFDRGSERERENSTKKKNKPRRARFRGRGSSSAH